VACLNVLEKAIDKVLIAGVPSYAVPLHSGDCLNTTLDEAWVWDVLDKYEPLPEKPTTSYVPLMRASAKIFEDDFERLSPRVRTKDESRRTRRLRSPSRSPTNGWPKAENASVRSLRWPPGMPPRGRAR
jgi:hypothetical protein